MRFVLLCAALAAGGLLALPSGAKAQSAAYGSTPTVNNSPGYSSSGRFWGTTGTGADSANMHYQDGLSASQVNAARQGFLLGNGSGASITAIGSQSIVSTTIFGDNNSANVTATQTTTNSGAVSNNGSIIGN
jgi:hypothetical protein